MAVVEESQTLFNLLVGLASGNVVNGGILVWLAINYFKLQQRQAVMRTHINYLRREVAYANGRAEPDDGELQE